MLEDLVNRIREYLWKMNDKRTEEQKEIVELLKEQNELLKKLLEKNQ